VAWACGPPDVVVGVEVGACLAVFGGDELQTVVVDEDICCAALQFIGGDGLLDGANGGCDDGVEALFINGALDGYVWKVVGG
jgi:hypothetical protein